jgi:hypothetical protein
MRDLVRQSSASERSTCHLVRRILQDVIWLLRNLLASLIVNLVT